MALVYLDNGNLTPGIHKLTWEEFVAEYGHNEHRKQLINGLKTALNYLKICNCKRVFIDGSFSSKKEKPGDWDGCFDTEGIDINRISAEYPMFWSYFPPREEQKSLFKGEIFPINAGNMLMLKFFQQDRNGMQKGVIQLSLQNFIL